MIRRLRHLAVVSAAALALVCSSASAAPTIPDGFAAVPNLVGSSFPDAAQALAHAHLGVAPVLGLSAGWTRAVRDTPPEHGIPDTRAQQLERWSGLPTPEQAASRDWAAGPRPMVRLAGVAQSGRVVFQDPRPGTIVRQAFGVHAVAVWDDCVPPLLPQGASVVCVPGAPTARRRDPLLRRLPWLSAACAWTRLHRGPGRPAPTQTCTLPHIDRTPALPALEFRPGTGYLQALRALFVSVLGYGRLPAGATLAAPLPAGKVVRLPASPKAGIAIDLRAPFGYDPSAASPTTGLIASPDSVWVTPPPGMGSEQFRADLRSGRALALPAYLGEGIERPRIASCEILRAARPTPHCRLPVR